MVGLLLLPPLGLLIARSASAVSMLLDRRRQRGKQLFNAGVVAAELAVIEIVYQNLSDVVVRSADVADPRSWAVAGCAVLAGDLTSWALVSLAIVLTNGLASAPRLFGNLVPVVATSLIATSVGLLGLVVVHVSAGGALLLGGLALVCVVGYRAYGRFLRQHESLNRVYDFSRSVERARSDPTVMGQALGQARDMFNASTAVLWARAVGQADAVIVTAGADGQVSTKASAGDASMDALRTTVGLSRRSRRFSLRDVYDGPLRVEMVRRGAEEMIVAPLRAGERVLGTLELSDRQGQLASFGDDDR